MESLTPDIATRFLCAWISVSIVMLCFEIMRGSSSKKRNTGWKVLAAAGVIDTVAIFTLPKTASALAAFAYLLAAFSGIGVYGIVWGIGKTAARRRCTARVEATITGSRVVSAGRSATRVYTAAFDYQGQTYEADELNGNANRTVAGYRPPEPPAEPADQKRAKKKGREYLRVGDSCTLLVNPRNPTEALYVNEHNVAIGVVSVLLGAFMAALCGFCLVYVLGLGADIIMPLLPI